MGKNADEVRKEGEVWEIVNREMRKRKRINEGIKWEEWKEHFMRLLGEVEVARGSGRYSGKGKE